MSAPKPGDRVRLTIEATITENGLFEACGDGMTTLLPRGIPFSVEVLAPPLPPEPPIGSYVADKNSVPWQREKNGLWDGGYTWDELNSQFGPVTLLIPAEQVVEELRALGAPMAARELAAKYGVTP